jgi:uncharacterized membrane protein YhaH (DUF805 family)
MNILNYFFGFDGRIGRASWWLGMLVLFVVSLMISFFAFAASAQPVVLVPAIIVRFAMLWPWFAISAKRWHDRDKSGVWSLITFVPLIGGIWMLVECGFLRGKSGSNDYGPAP